jgi:hypothetical protein
MSVDCRFTICGQAIEYAEEWPHLGHMISVHCEDEYDIINRRNRMCGQINNVLCFFDKRDPVVKIRLLARSILLQSVRKRPVGLASSV